MAVTPDLWSVLAGALGAHVLALGAGTELSGRQRLSSMASVSSAEGPSAPGRDGTTAHPVSTLVSGSSSSSSSSRKDSEEEEKEEGSPEEVPVAGGWWCVGGGAGLLRWEE